MSGSAPPPSQLPPSSLPSSKLPQGRPPRPPAQQPPLSPSARERERERISLLLTINGELLKELVRLQAEGKAGSLGQSPPQGPSPKEETRDEKDGVDGSVSTPKHAAPHPTFIE